MRIPAWILTALVLLMGTAVLGIATDGYRAFTVESARRLALQREPLELPDVLLRDQNGDRFHLKAFAGERAVVTFIYTRCTDVCPVEGALMAWLRNELITLGETGVALLSISFDPTDDRLRLAEYAHRHGARAPEWRVAGILEPAARRELLATLGVVVVADPAGGFTHNAAFYVLDEQGRAEAMFDLEQASALRRWLRTHT